MATIAELRKRRREQKRRAEQALEKTTLWDRLASLKAKAVREVEAINRNREKLRQASENGRIRRNLEQRFQDHQDDVLQQVRGEVKTLVGHIENQFGVTELPPEPISEQAHRRASLLVAQLDRMSDQELRDQIVDAAAAGDRAVVNNALRGELERRVEDKEFGNLPESDPLYEAREAAALANTNHQTLAAELARERASTLKSELSSVLRVLEDEGKWDGTMQSRMSPRYTPNLPPVGRTEVEVHGDKSDRDALQDWLDSLPTEDPVLTDLRDPDVDPDQRLRSRIENPTHREQEAGGEEADGE